jgi:hypothetical protein
MRLSVLKEMTKELHLQFGGEVLNVSYRPYAYTPELEEANAKAQIDASAGDTLKNMLIPVIEKWDMLDNYEVISDVDIDFAVTEDSDERTALYIYKGKFIEAYPSAVKLANKTEEHPVPLTVKGLHKIPVSVLGEILVKIGEDLTPGKENSSNSDGSF